MTTTDHETFKLAELEEACRRVAIAKPDHYYQNPDGMGCFYDMDATGDGVEVHGCFIGQGMHELGIPDTVIAGCTWAIGTRLGARPTKDMDPELLEWITDIDESGINWLVEAQAGSDGGDSFSGCVTRADADRDQRVGWLEMGEIEPQL